MVLRFLGARRDGLRPETGIRLYKMLARPILEYGSQILGYTKKQLEKLEQIQLRALKSVLGLQINTKNETVRLVSGVEPLRARFAFLKLKHLYRLQQKPNNSLVKIVFNKIRGAGASRPGFLAECREQCTEFGIAFRRLVPRVADQVLPEFAAELKADLYRAAFRRDFERVRDSNKASILASLFPPGTSYIPPFRYRHARAETAGPLHTHGIFAKLMWNFVFGQRFQ